MSRIFALVLVWAVLCGSAQGVMIFSPSEPPQVPAKTSRAVQNDPRLPAYDNPIESDLAGGEFHVSFLAVSKKDMVLRVEKDNDIFDGRGRKYHCPDGEPLRGSDGADYAVFTNIGSEETHDREIIAGIMTPIEFQFLMDPASGGTLPTIGRARFCFNGEWVEFRNLKVQDSSLWEEIRTELGL